MPKHVNVGDAVLGAALGAVLGAAIGFALADVLGGLRWRRGRSSGRSCSRRVRASYRDALLLLGIAWRRAATPPALNRRATEVQPSPGWGGLHNTLHMTPD